MTDSLRMIAVIAMAVLALAVGAVPAGANSAAKPPIKLAVFDFELEDATPAAALLGQATSSAVSLDKAASAARQQLEQSGRYHIVDVSGADDRAAKDRSLRHCDGCEARIARQLGADQSLLGIVRRATQTDYYVLILIRDARTGKIIDQQDANFAGSEEGWPSGVRMLIKHQVLLQ
jgi:hypothetical protein